MSPFDQAVIDLGKQGNSPDEIIKMLSETTGRLIVSSYRSRPARIERVRSFMHTLSDEMEKRKDG